MFFFLKQLYVVFNACKNTKNTSTDAQLKIKKEKTHTHAYARALSSKTPNGNQYIWSSPEYSKMKKGSYLF